MISGSLGVGAGFDWKLLNHIFIMGNIPKIWGYEYLQRNVLQVTTKKGYFPFNMQFFNHKHSLWNIKLVLVLKQNIKEHNYNLVSSKH